MSWRSQFVVFRVSPEQKITQVFESSDLQKAKYWIKYIAEVSDVLCRTPLSPKHTKVSTAPEYWCHKESSGQPVTDHKAWLDKARAVWPEVVFPENPVE